MTFDETRKSIGGNHGQPPTTFLTDIVNWCRQAPDSLFAPNDVPVDIFTAIKPKLGTLVSEDEGGRHFKWDNILHRRAAFCEAATIHSGRESDWRYHIGVDTTNRRSQSDIKAEEAGIFQVSFDSVFLPHGRKEELWELAEGLGIDTPEKFIHAMKFRIEERTEVQRRIVFDWYAAIMRRSITWAGPFVRHNADSVYPYLRRAAMLEFQQLLA